MRRCVAPACGLTPMPVADPSPQWAPGTLTQVHVSAGVLMTIGAASAAPTSGVPESPGATPESCAAPSPGASTMDCELSAGPPPSGTDWTPWVEDPQARRACCSSDDHRDSGEAT